MKVSLKCFSTLADGENCRHDRSGIFSLTNNDHTVRHLARMASVPETDVSVVFVNGKRASLRSTLSEGDRVALVPPTGGM